MIQRIHFYKDYIILINFNNILNYNLYLKKILQYYKMPPKKGENKKGGGKRKMNAFMQEKEKARISGAEEFEYTNKEGVKNTYKKFVTKTGMVTYKQK